MKNTIANTIIKSDAKPFLMFDQRKPGRSGVHVLLILLVICLCSGMCACGHEPDASSAAGSQSAGQSIEKSASTPAKPRISPEQIRKAEEEAAAERLASEWKEEAGKAWEETASKEAIELLKEADRKESFDILTGRDNSSEVGDGGGGNAEKPAETGDIYLTFDDGPCTFTPDLLAILDEYPEVKVTFFVTNDHAQFRYLMKEEADRGHTVALHSYSHRYETIYAGTDVFLRDLASLSAIVYDQTGIESRILRFPGGTANTVSAKYTKGIMSSLAAIVTDMGYVYFDWNVASGDTASGAEAADIADRIIDQIKKRGSKDSVVLQHDLKPKSIQAVRRVIEWGLENGYRFKALNVYTAPVHQKIAN